MVWLWNRALRKETGVFDGASKSIYSETKVLPEWDIYMFQIANQPE